MLRRTKLVALAASISVLAALALPAPQAGALTGTLFFNDDFRGLQFKGVNWDKSIDTKGVRWCASSAEWRDPSIAPCPPAGTTELPPWGSITQVGGEASFVADSSIAAPYVWRGLPSRPNPFPDSGDFTLKVRINFDHFRRASGFQVKQWADTTPSGSNDPGLPSSAIFAAWGYHDQVTHDPTVTVYFLGQTLTAAAPFSSHYYRIDYVGGAYSLAIDHVPMLGPIASAQLPNTILMGNPTVVPASTDWTDFRMDFVKVYT